MKSKNIFYPFAKSFRLFSNHTNSSFPPLIIFLSMIFL